MFLHSFRVERVTSDGQTIGVSIHHLDNFCMRNFTNDAVFDDTLPVADGLLEVGSLVPLDGLLEAMQAWFRRKRYLSEEDQLRITPLKRRADAL